MSLSNAEITLEGYGIKKTNDSGQVQFTDIKPGKKVIKIGSHQVWSGDVGEGDMKKIAITLPLLFVGCAMKKFRTR